VNTFFLPIMPCVLLVLYCPVCGWKYEEKLRTLVVFAPSTCTALKRKPPLCAEKQSRVVDWPFPKVRQDITLVAGGLLFLTVL
jgi:hypothetical protein